MASQNANEIDEIIKKLKENQGFQACIILNHDGVVLRWENHVSKSTTSSGSIGPGIGGNSTISTNMTDESVPNFQRKHGGIYLTYEKAVHYAGHVLDLYNESQIVMNDLMQDEVSDTVYFVDLFMIFKKLELSFGPI